MCACQMSDYDSDGLLLGEIPSVNVSMWSKDLHERHGTERESCWCGSHLLKLPWQLEHIFKSEEKMLDAHKKEMESLNITFILSDRDRAVLSSAIKQEWFDLLQKIMEEEIRLLNVKLINTDGSDENAIVANHRIAKGAAMFYKGIIDRLNEELSQHAYNAQKMGTPENPELSPSLDTL